MTKRMESGQKWDGFEEVQVTILAKEEDVERRQERRMGHSSEETTLKGDLPSLCIHLGCVVDLPS